MSIYDWLIFVLDKVMDLAKIPEFIQSIIIETVKNHFSEDDFLQLEKEAKDKLKAAINDAVAKHPDDVAVKFLAEVILPLCD